MRHHNLWRERRHSGGPSPVCLRGNPLDTRQVCLWPWLEHKEGREHSVRLVGCARERPLGAPLRPTFPPSELASCSSVESPQQGERVLSLVLREDSDKSSMAWRLLYDGSWAWALQRFQAKWREEQATGCAWCLSSNFHVQFSSLTTGQDFGRSGLLKWWSSPTFTRKRTGFFVFCFLLLFFFGRVIVVHIYPIARGAWQALIHMWQRVGHKWSNLAHIPITHWEKSTRITSRWVFRSLSPTTRQPLAETPFIT